MPNLDDNSAGVNSAAMAIRDRQPSGFHTMSDGDLADEYRGQRFARDRARDRLEVLEAEMKRRGLVEAKGRLALVTAATSDGLLDFKRIRAELGPGFVEMYRLPGSETFFKVRTLTAEERAAR